MPRHGLVLLATMSERESIPTVLDEVREGLDAAARDGWSFRVVVVDDGGDPSFGELCMSAAHARGLDLSFVDGPRRGLGSAVLCGFDVALADDGVEVVVNLDGDGQHDARQIPGLLRAHVASGSGLTIGSRWTVGGECHGLSRSRRVLSRAGAFALHLAGVPAHVKDPTTSFRAYSRRTVEAIRRDLEGFGGFSFFGAAVAVAHARGLSVSETPIVFRPRIGGASNLDIGKVTDALADLPRIASAASQARRRDRGFLRAAHGTYGPDSYNASRELELLSNTPVSTRIIVDELAPHIGRRVLEVGAGLGAVTMELVSRGRDVTALEPDPSLHARLNANVNGAVTVNGTLHEVPSGTVFDTVLYVNVLEHIRDDAAELRAAASHLAPGGNIVVFVPALPALYGTMDEVSGHHRRYRRAELSAVLAAAGLRTTTITSFDPVGVVPYWVMYRVMRRTSLGSASVGLYDRVIIPLSRAAALLTRGRGPGKNLVAVGSPAP
jgi:2-polyprenyl-3-methyl-5-hydroxy-6-metoxy-1,4-benzoquinol methylase